MSIESRITGKIIVALDVGNRDEALSLVHSLKAVKTVKVGLKLFAAEGPSFLQELRELGKNIFLDLKLHDIPNTVAAAVKICARYGVHMMTLHASGGREMMIRAAAAAREAAQKTGLAKPLLLAVTILTSLDNEAVREIGMPSGPKQQVARLANLAEKSGMDGVVCSPQEIALVKRETNLLVVSPGIRPVWAAVHDQKRIMTPAQAVEEGADYIVIGRPVIAAASPADAFKRIVEEMGG